MTPSSGARLGAALGSLCLLACRRPLPAGDSEADASSSLAAPAASSSAAQAAQRMPPVDASPGRSASSGNSDQRLVRNDAGALPTCTVMSGSEGGPNAHADPTRWLDLPAHSSFTVRTLETGRELRFEGPGRVRACGDEVALVATGAAVGLPGSGEAPGAEQWAATTCGVARWASGVHRFSASADACQLQSSVGTVHVWTAEDVAIDDITEATATDAAPPTEKATTNATWRRVDEKRTLRLKFRSRATPRQSAASALVACEHAAHRVDSIVLRLTGASAGAPGVGELAAESVTARGLARAACAVARVRLSLAAASEADMARLDAATVRWQAPH